RHQQATLEFEIVGLAACPFRPRHEPRRILRVDAPEDQADGDRRSRIDAEDAIGLLGPFDLVGRDAPRKGAYQAEALTLGEERFAPPERSLCSHAFDGDARDVRDLRDELLLTQRRRPGFALVHGERPEYPPLLREDRRA